MLIKTLRNLLKSKTIAQNANKNTDYIRQTIAGHRGRNILDILEYEVAGQALCEIKERHDNFILEQDILYNRTGSVDDGLRQKQDQEWELFLSLNT